MNWMGRTIHPWLWDRPDLEFMQRYHLRWFGHVPLIFLAPRLFSLGRIRRRLLCWWFRR